MNTLDKQIKDIVAENTIVVDFLSDKGIDFCCGGDEVLRNALADAGLEENAFLEEMDEFLKTAKEEQREKGELDVYDMDVISLIDHLETTHHVIERKYINQINEDLNKILIVHFDSHGEELLELHGLFNDLKKELEAHFVKEEKITFPMIERDLKAGKITEETLKKVEELESEHDGAGDIIKKMVELTNHFEVPEGMCFTFDRTYTTLHALVEDVFIHIFKENSILFEKLKGAA